MSKKIFTKAYNPWIMGGSCHYEIAIEIDEPDWVPLALGFEGAVVVDPLGRPHVVEKISGGIVGDTIEEVASDIVSCGDVEYMTKQVDEQKKLCEGAQIVAPDVFWKIKK